MRDLDSCESSFKLETLSYNTKGFLIWNGQLQVSNVSQEPLSGLQHVTAINACQSLYAALVIPGFWSREIGQLVQILIRTMDGLMSSDTTNISCISALIIALTRNNILHD